jgi:hypothetical protein
LWLFPRFCYGIVDLFQQCRIVCFSFYDNLFYDCSDSSTFVTGNTNNIVFMVWHCVFSNVWNWSLKIRKKYIICFFYILKMFFQLQVLHRRRNIFMTIWKFGYIYKHLSKWQPYNISVPLDIKVTCDTRLILNIIYVWKLNQTGLELDFWAVKFLFFPRRDLNSHHWYTAAPIA